MPSTLLCMSLSEVPLSPQLAAIYLVAADLERQACNTVEQALRGKRDIFDLPVQIRQVSDQRIGFVTDIGAIGAEQFDFDPVKTMACVRPGVNLLIELGHETAREDLGAFPSDTGLDPSPLGTIEIRRRRRAHAACARRSMPVRCLR